MSIKAPLIIQKERGPKRRRPALGRAPVHDRRPKRAAVFDVLFLLHDVEQTTIVLSSIQRELKIVYARSPLSVRITT